MKHIIQMVNIDRIIYDRLPSKGVSDLVILLQNGWKPRPVKLQALHNGKFRLRDGRHRLAAHLKLGVKFILGRYKSGSL